MFEPPLALVPLGGGGVYYCAVQLPGSRVELVRQVLDRGGSMVLLEFAPQMVGTTFGKRTQLQLWPAHVTEYSRALGLEPQVLGEIPLVTADFLRIYESDVIDYVTAGVLKRGRGQLGRVTEWRQLRKRLQRSLLPEGWDAPGQCEAIVHIAGHEVVVVLTPNRNYVIRLLEGLMSALAMGDSLDASLVQRVYPRVARWLLAEMRETGARIERLSLAASPRGDTVRVLGCRGRGDLFPWSVGAVDGDLFTAELTVS